MREFCLPSAQDMGVSHDVRSFRLLSFLHFHQTRFVSAETVEGKSCRILSWRIATFPTPPGVRDGFSPTLALGFHDGSYHPVMHGWDPAVIRKIWYY